MNFVTRIIKALSAIVSFPAFRLAFGWFRNDGHFEFYVQNGAPA